MLGVWCGVYAVGGWHWWWCWKLFWGVMGHVVGGVRDGDFGEGVLDVVGSWGSGVFCGIVGTYAFWSWLLHVAATPSMSALWWTGLVLSPRRRSVVDFTMARLILVQMKLAMSE